MSVPATMLGQALDFPRQLRSGLAAGDAAGMADRRPAAVAICGLGGSAAGGRLLTAKRIAPAVPSGSSSTTTSTSMPAGTSPMPARRRSGR